MAARGQDLMAADSASRLPDRLRPFGEHSVAIFVRFLVTMVVGTSKARKRLRRNDARASNWTADAHG